MDNSGTVPTLPRRDPFQIAPPIVLDNAYDDPDEILRIVRRRAPYQLTATLQNFGAEIRRAVGPNFRYIWHAGDAGPATDGDLLLNNPRFIQAGRDLFKAEIVRPRSVMVNLSLPFDTQPWPHVDLPTFLGCDHSAVPDWMRGPMGNSGLFANWALPVPAAVAWFYRGVGGDFEYWPQGSNASPEVMMAPMWNQAVVSDNDYMYHRVSAQGRPEDYLQDELSADAMLHYDATTDRWIVLDAGREVMAVQADQLRISILWKALAFSDDAEVQRYDSGEDDLDIDRITGVFAKDLLSRKIAYEYPSDPANDPVWQELLRKHYPARIQVDGWQPRESAGAGET